MAFRFRMTPDDFLKGGIPKAGWHNAQIVKYEEKQAGPNAKNPGSLLINLHFKIVAGEDKGKIVYQNFSEVAPGFAVPLIEALGAKIDKKKDYEGELNERNTVNKFVDINVAIGSFNNKPKADIIGYKPYSGPVAHAPAVAGV